MKINQFDIWLANLNPQIGTEPGKTRPVLIVQTNLLNTVPHPSTIVCPLTTQVADNVEILRVHLKEGVGHLKKSSDIMLDQVRAIDNNRLIKKIGTISNETIEIVRRNMKIILDLE